MMDVKKTGAAGSPTTQPTAKPSDQPHNQTSSHSNAVNASRNSVAQLKMGQHIELLVIKMTDTQAFLATEDNMIQMHTTDKSLLQVGQRLQAKIIKMQPQVLLSVLNKNSLKNDKTNSLINSTLRQTLPLQQPLKTLLDNIKLLNKTIATNDPSLQIIKDNFIQSLPPSQAFESASILPKIFQRSGLFTENLLAKSIIKSSTQTSFPNNDLKVALLRLATQLRALHSTSREHQATVNSKTFNLQNNIDVYSPSLMLQNQKINTSPKQTQVQQHQETKPPLQTPITKEQFIEKLIHLTEGTIAKLHTQQLQQHQLNESQKPAWVFELPIRADSSLDSTTIYINKDDTNKNNNPYTTPWSLIIKLNIEGLGEIQANVKLQGLKISVLFWFDSKQTSILFSEHLQLLDAKLHKIGLESKKLQCHHGAPPPITTVLPSPSFSEKT